jgi:hypothetical protein
MNRHPELLRSLEAGTTGRPGAARRAQRNPWWRTHKRQSVGGDECVPARPTGHAAGTPLASANAAGGNTGPRRMDQTSITAAGAIDTFLVLLIGIGPKIALVPFLEITASLDPADKQRVLRKMMTTAATVAVVLMVRGELLRALLHFTIGSLSIAGGVILRVLAVWMVLAPPASGGARSAGKDPMQLAQFPLAVPYCSIRWASSA